MQFGDFLFIAVGAYLWRNAESIAVRCSNKVTPTPTKVDEGARNSTASAASVKKLPEISTNPDTPCQSHLTASVPVRHTRVDRASIDFLIIFDVFLGSHSSLKC